MIYINKIIPFFLLLLADCISIQCRCNTTKNSNLLQMQKTNLKSEFLVDTNRQTTLLQQEILNSKDPIYLIKDPI